VTSCIVVSASATKKVTQNIHSFRSKQSNF
jgi:hypothetical protein